MTEVTPLFNYISQKVCPDNLHRQFSSHRYVNVIYQTTGYFTTTKDVEWMAVDKFWNIFLTHLGCSFSTRSSWSEFINM